jgi:hypothetical protein
MMPRIARAITVASVLIALDGSDFSAEIARIQSRAWNLGGSKLPPALWADLESWILTQLIERTAAADDMAQAQQAVANHVAVQVWATERRIRTACA